MCEELNDAYIKQLLKPDLDNPIFIEGLPGFGNVGKVTAQLVTKFCDAKLFAEYYSSYFPDYVVVRSDGICYPPRYEFYSSSSSSKRKLSLVILTGDSQPPFDNPVAHYEICTDILDFIERLGCSSVITVGGVPIKDQKRDVYVAATSHNLAAEVMEKGAIIYGKGRIMGATGLLLGLAKEKGMDGICLLGGSDGLQTDEEAGMAVFRILLRILGQEADHGM